MSLLTRRQNPEKYSFSGVANALKLWMEAPRRNFWQKSTGWMEKNPNLLWQKKPVISDVAINDGNTNI